jgi:hypothetical protein
MGRKFKISEGALNAGKLRFRPLMTDVTPTGTLSLLVAMEPSGL